MSLIRAAALLAILASTSAVAQTNTYRPGKPYAAVPAGSPDACERTCGGDAGCKAWNHVAIGNGGVCELLGVDVAPVASPNATSGVALGGLHPATSRVVRVPGGSTLRLGTPEPAAPAVPPRIVRPLPRRAAPMPAVAKPAATSPAPVPSRPVRRAFRHGLDSAPVMVVRRPVSAPIAPLPAPSLPAPRGVAQPPANPPAREAPAAAPTPSGPQLAGLPSPRLPVTQESLFGSLYDDVSAPAPADPGALADPDAPVATATARPVTELD